VSAAAERDQTVLAERVRLEVERTIQRSLKGLEYFGSPAPVVGHTPKDVIYEQGTLHLYHYHPQVGELYRVPILIVMATSNRGYILDLAPGQSFVEYLLRQGYDVYLIDWSAPIAADSGLTFADYTLRFIPECAQRVRDDSGENDVTVIGYCMGGVLSVMYAALHPTTSPTSSASPRRSTSRGWSCSRSGRTGATSTSTGWSTRPATCRRS
jgi:polyhydroxyalkanoate synthase